MLTIYFIPYFTPFVHSFFLRSFISVIIIIIVFICFVHGRRKGHEEEGDKGQSVRRKRKKMKKKTVIASRRIHTWDWQAREEKFEERKRRKVKVYQEHQSEENHLEKEFQSQERFFSRQVIISMSLITHSCHTFLTIFMLRSLILLLLSFHYYPYSKNTRE